MKKIMIIEDELNQQEAYKLKLAASYELVFGQTGDEVPGLLQTNMPDLIILDVMLPGGQNGFDVLNTIKEDPKTSNIPVIMLTNLGEEQKETAINCGAAEFLNKTLIGPADLEKILEKYI
jgi:CheY-like chemotaxis protein